MFPEVVAVSMRDSEWRYDDYDREEAGLDQYEEDEDLLGQTFTFDTLDGEEEPADGDDVVDEDEELTGEDEDEEEDEWDVEPQTEVIAYLQSVRSEASGLPSLTYVSELQDQPSDTSSKPLSNEPTLRNESDHIWQAQFLKYYRALRETIAAAPEPILSQHELDSLLHINPYNRPQTHDQEDRLWRLKTLDQPSVLLLSMLDHQRTIHLLTHLRKKLSERVKEEQCIWLVFLLARLGDLGILSGSEVDLLRRIGRKCLGIRNSVEDGAEGTKVVLGTVDMAVCIIMHYYQQKDLEETIQESI